MIFRRIDFFENSLKTLLPLLLAFFINGRFSFAILGISLLLYNLVKRDLLLKSLNFVQGVVEKKNTLPILSNVLLQLKNKKLSIVATDLDIIFYNEIEDVKIVKEGSTTTSAAILYDILRNKYNISEEFKD